MLHCFRHGTAEIYQCVRWCRQCTRNRNAAMLSKRWSSNRQIFVNDDRIILLSLCEPTLEFSFTPYRWMQFVIRLSPYKRKAMESRCHGLFRRHLSDGYYIVVMYHYTSLVLGFRQPCNAPRLDDGHSQRSFPAGKVLKLIYMTNGSIYWMRSFRVYIITTRSLPRFYHRDMNVPMVMVIDVVWEEKVAHSVIHLDMLHGERHYLA